MVKLIGHVDSDCFYVSAERVRNPALHHVPTGVLGNQGACVIAKSYEMKAYGVKTGTPIWDAIKICPQGVYVKRDFRWYEAVSRQMLDLLHTVSPLVEYYSVDEMFFDADELPNVFGQPLEEATKSLQQRIREQIGIPASIGIAATKTLAKLGSDSAKPFGCHILLDQLQSFLKSQPVGELCGIGRRSEIKLAEHNIHTCWDYAQADRLFIRKLLTIKGEGLWWELHGEAVNSIQTKRPAHKIISRGGSVGRKTDDLERLTALIVRNVERLIEALDHHRVDTQFVALELEFEGVTGCRGEASLPGPTASFKRLVAIGKALLHSAPIPAPVSHMHLLAERLTIRNAVQRSLFWKPDNSPVDLLKQKINRQVGRFAIRSGDTLALKELYDDEANEYDICDICGKMCF